MVSRLAVTVVLLVSALLMPVTAPHHSAAPAVELKTREQTAAAGSDHLGPAPEHCGAADRPLALPFRAQQIATPRTAPADTARGAAWAAAHTQPAGPAHPRTARDRRSPCAGAAPTSAALQIFRC